MKRISILFFLLKLSVVIIAQVPNKISYQAVIRNTNNTLVSNTQVKMRITISKGSLVPGDNVYSELHTLTTNANGLVSLEIGNGSIINGNFSTIRWEEGPYFLTTETDPANGNNYTIAGTSQLLSVPYSLYASKSSNGVPDGGIQGQVVTLCSGIPTWTTGGICPGVISSLNCGTVAVEGYLAAGLEATGVLIILNYTGGNGLGYQAQTTNSTGVTGLTASLEAGSFANGNGILKYTISGTPGSVGNANFTLNAGGQSCNVIIPVYNASLSVHTCGTPNIHNPARNYGVVKDKDGNDYKTVQIGTQIWMAENLKTTKYQNGDPISNPVSNTQWQNSTSGAYCSYDNNNVNDCPGGKLYNWFAVNDNRKICPAGWHIPAENEWNTLSAFLGGDNVSGDKLKSTNTQFWDNSGALTSTNSTGFSGLAAGFRNDFGFNDKGFYGYWWSSDENDDMFAVSRGLFYDGGAFYRFDEKKSVGYSVRCLKD